jgi:YVTN family beta-propeller protein
LDRQSFLEFGDAYRSEAQPPSPDALWVSQEHADTVARLDPTTAALQARIKVGRNPLASAFIRGRFFVPNIESNTVSIIDPATNTVVDDVPAGSGPIYVAEAGRAIWVAGFNGGALVRLSPSG